MSFLQNLRTNTSMYFFISALHEVGWCPQRNVLINFPCTLYSILKMLNMGEDEQAILGWLVRDQTEK